MFLCLSCLYVCFVVSCSGQFISTKIFTIYAFKALEFIISWFLTGISFSNKNIIRQVAIICL